jgi:hypothetical protein
MRAINTRAKKIMDILTEMCTHLGDHDKFHTEGPFMDVSVECIGKCNLGPMFSIAHYYEQNGDLMRDPEMCFIKGGDGEYYPYYYRLDGLGIEQEAVTWDIDGTVKRVNPLWQRSQAAFAGTWMRNIKNQQERVE